MCFFVLLKCARTQKILQRRQGRSWCQCSCQEERFDPGQWPGRRRGRGREMLLVPVHQGPKCSEEGAVHEKVRKLLSRV